MRRAGETAHRHDSSSPRYTRNGTGCRIAFVPVRPGPGLLLTLLVTAAIAGATVGAQDQVVRDGRPFRTGIELTSITVTVRDAQGRLVTGLGREAFEVREDGELQ